MWPAGNELKALGVLKTPSTSLFTPCASYLTEPCVEPFSHGKHNWLNGERAPGEEPAQEDQPPAPRPWGRNPGGETESAAGRPWGTSVVFVLRAREAVNRCHTRSAGQDWPFWWLSPAAGTWQGCPGLVRKLPTRSCLRSSVTKLNSLTEAIIHPY